MVNAHKTMGNSMKNNDSFKSSQKYVISQPPSQSSCVRLNLNSHAIMFNDMIQRITSTESTYTINVFRVHFATDTHASLQPLRIQLTS